MKDGWCGGLCSHPCSRPVWGSGSLPHCTHGSDGHRCFATVVSSCVLFTVRQCPCLTHSCVTTCDPMCHQACRSPRSSLQQQPSSPPRVASSLQPGLPLRSALLRSCVWMRPSSNPPRSSQKSSRAAALPVQAPQQGAARGGSRSSRRLQVAAGPQQPAAATPQVRGSRRRRSSSGARRLQGTTERVTLVLQVTQLAGTGTGMGSGSQLGVMAAAVEAQQRQQQQLVMVAAVVAASGRVWSRAPATWSLGSCRHQVRGTVALQGLGVCGGGPGSKPMWKQGQVLASYILYTLCQQC
jgi:hypothetical protein